MPSGTTSGQREARPSKAQGVARAVKSAGAGALAPTAAPTTAATTTHGGAGVDALRAKQVELILERVDALPTLSTVAARIIKLSSGTDVALDEVAKIIESDPALSTRILGLTRKAERGLGDKITTVKRAVVMLGLEAVRAAVLSVSVYDVLTREDEKQRKELDESLAEGGTQGGGAGGFDRAGYWKHSIAVACASELIAAEQKKRELLPEEAFLAGLLHGVGRVALDWVLPRAYDRVVRLAEKRACASSAVERQLIGLDYPTAGKRLAEHWQLPEVLQNVIWLHDQPVQTLGEQPGREMIVTVACARALCRTLHLGWSGDYSPLPDPARLWAQCGLVGTPEGIVRRLHDAVAQRMALLGLDQVTTPQLLLESLANATKQLSRSNALLQARAGAAAQQARAGELVVEFQQAMLSVQGARGRGAGGASRVAEEILRSALRAMGDADAFAAVVTQAGELEPWQLTSADDGGSITAQVLEPSVAQRSLAQVLERVPAGSGAAGVMPLVCEHLAHGPDARELMVLPLGAEGATPLAGAVIVTRTALVCAGDLHALRALRGAWAMALGHALQERELARAGERIASANRELASAQQKLAEQESLARLGETTAGAAHEMNNPLTVIAGRSQLLLTRLRDERDKAAAAAIGGAARQIGELIQSMHLLSTRPTPKKGECLIKELIAKAVETAQTRVAADVRVQMKLEAAPAKVSLDAELVGGALAELLANALEACPQGPVSVTCAAQQGKLVFSVLDHGPGLSEKAKLHAFDPFFSERAAGRGRGLGLTRAKRMAEAVLGEIVLTTPSEGGTLGVLRVGMWEPIVTGPKPS